MRAVARLQLQSWGEQCTAVRAAVELDSSDRTALQTADGGVQCRRQCGNGACVLRAPRCCCSLQGMPSVLQSLARSSDSLGVCATRGTNSISDSLLGIEAADVALLVVRVLAAAIPSEDYWRFSDVSRGVRAAPRRAPTSEGLRQGPQPHTSRCVRPRTAVRAATPPSGYLLSEVFAGARAVPESSDERDVRGIEMLLVRGFDTAET